MNLCCGPGASAPLLPSQIGFPMISTLSAALAERGYDALTPVQEAVTDPALAAADLLVSAQTGSGKTVGFGLAIAGDILGAAEALDPASAGAPRGLVIAPTRELAFQVMRELTWLYAQAGARVIACTGGMDMRDERRALERGAHIVVGTPGRLTDHIKRGALDLSALRVAVLDEADEMLDLGFREDLEFILGEAPAARRTLLFSATVPPVIAELAKTYQRDAVRVSTITKGAAHADIAYQALQVAQQDAETAVINVLRFHEAQNAIVFANTRAAVNRLTTRLANRGFAVVALSGELSQSERTHALQAMRDGRARVCVATDVAARGIDLPKLDLVVHAELPSNPEALLHRSGRTGRAGRKGVSALIVPPRARARAQRLLKFAKLTAEWTEAPGAEAIHERDEARLLADPTWTAEAGTREAAFAAKLAAQHSAEAIAAAYLRLYRTRNAAPEELSPPDAPAPRRERAPFGPSAWVALSVGRRDRAEPRWLLPLLCRAGGLDKDAIGAIRIRETESWVEVAEAEIGALMERVGTTGLEKGVTLRRMEEAPGPDDQAPRRAPRPGGERDTRKPGAKPRFGTKPPRAAGEAAAGSASDRAQPAPAPAPRAAQADKPRKPRHEARAPAEAAAAPRKPAPDGGPKRHGGSDRAGGKAAAKPAHAKRAPGQGKPFGKPGDSRGKPFGKPGEGRGKPFGKPARAGKPAAAGAAGPARRAAKPRADASDTSKRFTPPGRVSKGGNAVLRRAKH